ncbi:hypothetical protein IF1G_00026 [Cordyceps javanica]|uniref:Uncharacterized protein n=1 Tax=Cordyceps javanica TaxID=43265 RepID=A0A545VEE7_9HYPO|nr:hypothetical protein IF1G_00026 [Cordyceps javanica]
MSRKDIFLGMGMRSTDMWGNAELFFSTSRESFLISLLSSVTVAARLGAGSECTCPCGHHGKPLITSGLFILTLLLVTMKSLIPPYQA